MITQEQFQRISQALPVLGRSAPELTREFTRAAFYARISAGKDVFVEGDQVDAIALLLSGVVRVYKIGETGREITLYRFGMGESCILTANAILSQKLFPAIAVVEQDAEAVMIPSDSFRDWVHRHDLWRGFVFDLLSQRLASVMAIVEEVASRRMDTRLAAFLAGRSSRQNPIAVTHQEIAAELGTAREVVSRILEDFTGQGLIRSTRGAIEILDLEELRRRGSA